MLGAGHYGRRVAKVLALKAPDPRRSKLGAKVRIFPGGLHHASPAPVHADVHHRRVGELKTGCGSFACNRGRIALNPLAVEAASLRQRDWEYDPEPMDHVFMEHQGYAQAAAFQRILLKAAGEGGAARLEYGTHLIAGNGGPDR